MINDQFYSSCPFTEPTDKGAWDNIWIEQLTFSIYNG